MAVPFVRMQPDPYASAPCPNAVLAVSSKFLGCSAAATAAATAAQEISKFGPISLKGSILWNVPRDLLTLRTFSRIPRALSPQPLSGTAPSRDRPNGLNKGLSFILRVRH